jgi:filamentous hemagglutinin family protein
VVRGGNGDRVDGGAARGANLFHSFSEFNVNAGQRVYFANPAGVANILSRVTGTDVSDIMGTLGVDGSANLFLLNPNGIIFGPDARLDVGGSFTASTANSFTFPDGGEFSATNPGDPSLLSVAVPLGVQYGAIPPGAITNAGNLSVGQNLTLSAGVLSIGGELQSGIDLTLEGQNRVDVLNASSLAAGRDVVVRSPGVINVAGGQLESGNDLILEAQNSVEVLNPSQLNAGRDIVVRSPIRALANGQYTVGGYFVTQELNGSVVDFLIPHERVILTSGGVTLNTPYTDAPLYILASGGVQTGNITINSSENTTPTTFIIPDGQGGIQSISLQAASTPNLDIRSGNIRTGIAWNQLRGIQISGAPVTGNINTSGTTFTPGLLDGVQVGNINTSAQTGNAGSVVLSASGIITTSAIDTSASQDADTGINPGVRAGNIRLTAGGTITIHGDLNAFANGFAGDIYLESANGAIDTQRGVLPAILIMTFSLPQL